MDKKSLVIIIAVVVAVAIIIYLLYKHFIATHTTTTSTTSPTTSPTITPTTTTSQTQTSTSTSPTSTSSTSSSTTTTYIIQNTCNVPLEFILPNYYGSTLNISLVAGQMFPIYLSSQSLLNNAYFLYGSQKISAQIASCTPVTSYIPVSETNCTVVPTTCPSTS